MYYKMQLKPGPVFYLQFIDLSKSAWDLVKPCHLWCQAFTRTHADTSLYHLGKTNTDSVAVLDLWDQEIDLRSELESVDRKRALVNIKLEDIN